MGNQKNHNLEDQKSKSMRLILLDEENLQEKSSFRITAGNIYLLITSVFILNFLLAYLLIRFTPLKYTISGVDSSNVKSEQQQIYMKLQEVNDQADAIETYLTSIQLLLTDDPTKMMDSAGILVNEIPVLSSQSVINDDKSVSPHDINYLAPISGIISKRYENEKGHFGIDIVAPKNTPIKSILPGQVIVSDWSMNNGHMIGIQHLNGILSFYKHNSSRLKKVGDYVAQGEAIAIIGNSGEHSTGPHVHFELWHQGGPVNPEDFIYFGSQER